MLLQPHLDGEVAIDSGWGTMPRLTPSVCSELSEGLAVASTPVWGPVRHRTTRTIGHPDESQDRESPDTPRFSLPYSATVISVRGHRRLPTYRVGSGLPQELHLQLGLVVESPCGCVSR